MVDIQKKVISKAWPTALVKYWPQIIIFVLGLSVSWPLIRSGYFSHQDDLHIIRLFEMRKCLVDFQIPCRWTPDMAWGNGMPLFNFYGPSIYYLGAILSFLVGFIGSAKILFFLSLVLGGVGMYLMAKSIWGKYPALVSGVLYTFAPYKALDIYVRGALSEVFAISLIPFVFYFYYELIKNSHNTLFIILSTTSLFFFLITHNIMTVIFLPVLILWLIYWLWVGHWKSIKIIFLTLLMSFGISAFFTIPAFFEKELVQTESLTRFELDYRANFLSVRQLFLDRVWGYGTSIPGPEGGMNFQIGWPYWLLAGASVFIVFSKKIKKSTKLLIVGVISSFLISIFMTHNKSTFIWENIRILSYFQFPWRFLSLSIFSTSILGGVVVFMAKEKWQKAIAIAIIVLTVILNWSYFKPREFYDITDKDKLSGELWEEQRRGAILDYLPKTALEPREAAPSTPFVISGKANVREFDNRSNRWEFTVSVDELAEIHVPVYYFPNWEVFVDGKAFLSTHDNLLGRISVTLEPGTHKVEGIFKNTPIRTVANVITLVSIVGFIGFVKWKKEK